MLSLLRVLALPVTLPLYLWWLWLNAVIAIPVWGLTFALRAFSWLFSCKLASAPSESTNRSCPLADDASTPTSHGAQAMWRTNDLYVTPRRTNNVTPRAVKSPTPRGLRRFSTLGPSAGSDGACTSGGPSPLPASDGNSSADGVRLSLLLPRSGRLTAKALLNSLQSLIGNHRGAAAGHRFHRSLRLSSSLRVSSSPARPAEAAGAGQQSAVGKAVRAADGACCPVALSSPEQEHKVAITQQAAVEEALPASESPASEMEADGASSPACGKPQSSPLLPRRTGSLRRLSTDSAFDAAEQQPLVQPLVQPLPLQPQPSALQTSQLAVRTGPRQHADLLLHQLPGDAGAAHSQPSAGGNGDGCGDGDLQERAPLPRCVECNSPVPAGAPAIAPAAPEAPAFASPQFCKTNGVGGLGSPGTSAAGGSPSLPCPAAYVLQRGGIDSRAAPITAPRPRRLSGLHTPPAQHLTASPAALPKAQWASSGGASSVIGTDCGAVKSSALGAAAAACAASPALETPLSPRGAAVVFARATATNAEVMAQLSSDKSQVAAVAACALTSDGGSAAGSTVRATARRGAVKAGEGGAGAAGRSPASVCGSSTPKAGTGRVLQRSAASAATTRQSAGGAYAGGGGSARGGGGGGAGTVSSGSSSLAGGLYGAGGALPRYLQPTASFSAKQGRK